MEKTKTNIAVRFYLFQIYNEKTYHIRLIKTDVDGNANEENCTGNDSLKAIKNILSAIPSADGLPLEILKSKMIPDDLFYHGFTTRSGGVSTYPTMKSLPLAMSLSKKDTRVYIEENRHRLARSEGFSYDSFYVNMISVFLCKCVLNSVQLLFIHFTCSVRCISC